VIDTRNQWLAELSRLSPFIRTLNLVQAKDFSYVERPPGRPVFRDADAFNLSNSTPHNQIIVDAIDTLRGRMPDDGIRSLIGELTYRKTYGAFSELVAYKWLGEANVNFTPQVPMNGSEVINPNGSIIDGQMILADKTVYFDIKAFGFHDHIIKMLQDRLDEALNERRVLIEGAWDLSIESLQELLDSAGFSKLVQELQGSTVVRRGRLEFRTQEPRPVTISSHTADPHVLANENRAYPLRFAGQYSRHNPFLLVFVIHPWFSQGGGLHGNFAGFVDQFMKELARLTFLSFRNDQTAIDSISASNAAKLLSGLVFLNGWPPEGTDAPRSCPFCRIYLNPIATHRLRSSDFSSIVDVFRDDVVVEEIAHSSMP
jgi:hypothetical protein